MYEDYLKDSNYFALEARKKTNEQERKRYYRVSVFCAWSAIEAFVNYIGDTLGRGDFERYEIAFITDKRFGVCGGKFDILDQSEYHKLEDKLKFLIYKFCPTFNFEKILCWSQLLEFKKFRDSLTHPRKDEDETDVGEYERRIKTGLSSIIAVMDHLCQGIFKEPLRRQVKDLSLQ
ncbi:MAG TPA: hypothetical protein ACFYD2_01670 [Candidatus Avalokitesvara rifleensis]|uniref:hypothetical protein n=1 Tax=Candidatus Avalokitesvara rifleensis TaxID=3367620 RepID=UPI0027122953|nr:hypothetical protein [Candidatus Brocadiales bacterium]